MSQSPKRASRPLALVCAVAVGAALVPATAFAGEPTRADRPSALRTSVDRAAVAESSRLEQSKRADVRVHAKDQSQGQSGGDPALASGSFFRTPAGIAVLAVFGVGLGYALYSTSNDRIRSSGR